MALTSVEETQIRDLLAQQSALLSLAGNEPTITSKLGATKVALSDLTSASTLDNADLMLIRQGVTDKSISGSKLYDAMRGTVTPTIFNSVLRPTVAPSPSSPSQLLINLNNETFMWDGANWRLIANGYNETYTQASAITLTSGSVVDLGSFTMPRNGKILATACKFANATGGVVAQTVGFYFYKNGSNIGRIGLIAVNGVTQFEASGAQLIDVSAGDIVTVMGTAISTGGNLTSAASSDRFSYNYIS